MSRQEMDICGETSLEVPVCWKIIRPSMLAVRRDHREKKSRFIATVRLVEKEEDALAFIEEMKKKYWDARHNCYAYSIGEHREFTRCSDDGEPSGTAGRPMLDVILGEDIYNVAVVVTRYFGGVLLGTGGLVRAYSGAVQAGLGASKVIEKHHGISWRLQRIIQPSASCSTLPGKISCPFLTQNIRTE